MLTQSKLYSNLLKLDTDMRRFQHVPAAFEDCSTRSVVCLGGLLVALGDAAADVLHRGMLSMHADEDDIRIHMGGQDHQ